MGRDVYSEDAAEFGTLFLLGESEHEEPVEMGFGELSEEHHRMHVLRWETGESFCGAVSDGDGDDDALEVTRLMGSNSLNMIGVCDDCLDSLMEVKPK